MRGKLTTTLCLMLSCLSLVGCGSPDNASDGGAKGDANASDSGATRDANPSGLLLGHTDFINAVAYSPDGKHIVTASQDGTAILWDAEALKPSRSFPAEAAVRGGSVAFSPDSQRFALGSTHGFAVWDVAKNRELWKASRSTLFLTTQVTYSPDGDSILSTNSASIELWDAANGAPIREFSADEIGVLWERIAFRPDGQHIGAVGDKKFAAIWDVATGEQIYKLEGHSLGLLCMAYSPDGKQLVTGSLDETAIIWDADNGNKSHVLEHGGLVYAVAYSPDGQWIATGGESETSEGKSATIVMWDAKDGRRIREMKGALGTQVYSLSFSPDGAHLASSVTRIPAREAEFQGAVIWDTQAGEVVRTFGKTVE